MADRGKKAPSDEDKLDAIVDEGFDEDEDEDYVFIDDEDDAALPVRDADSDAAAAGLHSKKAPAELCVLGDDALGAVEISQTEDGKLRENDQWVTVTRDALDKTSSSVPTIKDAVRRATSAGGGAGGGGGGGKSSAQQEAETAVKTLLIKGGKLVGKEGVAAMKGLIQTKIGQSKEMAKVVVQKLREHPFLMKVAESSALPLVQVVGATNVSAAQQSHREAVTLFCDRYEVDTFCSFALTKEKVYEIKQLTLSGITDFHKRSPADILVAIDASCFPDMKGYNASMGSSPLIIGLSLKSVLNYGQAPFANPGLPSVLGNLREKLGDKLVPNKIEDIVGEPYKKCVAHLKAAAGVKTNTALKEKFKSAKNEGDEMKLGQGGDQDKLLARLAQKKVVGAKGLGRTAQYRLRFCKGHLINVRNEFRKIFQAILDKPEGQRAMKEHIIEVWKKIASPIYWFKVTGQGSTPILRARSRSDPHKREEGYKAEFIDPNESRAMVLLKNPSSIIRIYDAGGEDTKVSFSLIITLGKEEIPLIQIRVKKESYMGTSLKLSGERCAGGICKGGGKGGGGGGGGSRKKRGGSRRKRRKRRTRRTRRTRRKRRLTRKKRHHVRRRRRKTRRKKKY